MTPSPCTRLRLRPLIARPGVTFTSLPFQYSRAVSSCPKASSPESYAVVTGQMSNVNKSRRQTKSSAMCNALGTNEFLPQQTPE